MVKQDYKKMTEQLAVFAGILQPMMTIPQVIQIYGTKSATGVSLVTWIGYAVLGLVFLIYGIVHRLKPIWITQILWFTLQMSVVMGVLIYG